LGNYEHHYFLLPTFFVCFLKDCTVKSNENKHVHSRGIDEQQTVEMEYNLLKICFNNSSNIGKLRISLLTKQGTSISPVEIENNILRICFNNSYNIMNLWIESNECFADFQLKTVQ